MVGAEIDYDGTADLAKKVGEEFHAGRIEMPLTGSVLAEQLIDVDRHGVAELNFRRGMGLEYVQEVAQELIERQAVPVEHGNDVRLLNPVAHTRYFKPGCNQEGRAPIRHQIQLRTAARERC